MGSIDNFLSKFGGGGTDEAPSEAIMLSASAPNALGAFLERFTTLTESYWFYKDSDQPIELRFDKEAHKYFKVDPELGNLIEQYGVTTVLKIIDKSFALVPWAVKKAAEKLLRTAPVYLASSQEMRVPDMTLVDFTKLVMEAKDAHREILTDAGDIGGLAHKCLEDSIQYAIDNSEGIVHELRNLPTDEKALACSQAAFAWMQQHNVKWLKTEQKIYSREYEYAGTMDGKCLVSSCDDPSCCNEQFVDSLSIADWKSSNALHIEYVFQIAGAYEHAEREEYGEDIQNCFILRLGKNEDEAGKFEPWRVPAKDFPEAFQGFLTCLNLVKLIDAVTKRMQMHKKGVREVKKKMKAEQKAVAKATAKAEREAERAQKKVERTAERERIKAEAKKNREEAKLDKLSKEVILPASGLMVRSGDSKEDTGEMDEPVRDLEGHIENGEALDELERTEHVNEVPGTAEDTETTIRPEHKDSQKVQDVRVRESVRIDAPDSAAVPSRQLVKVVDPSLQSVAMVEYEETPVRRFVITEEG